jgi:hypothetical protein
MPIEILLCHLGTSRSKKSKKSKKSEKERSTAVGYSQAIHCYDKATQLNSDYFEAWNNKGVVYMYILM